MIKESDIKRCFSKMGRDLENQEINVIRKNMKKRDARTASLYLDKDCFRKMILK